MRKLLILNIILILGFSAFLVVIFDKYHPVIALNKASQGFVQNPNKHTYQVWFDYSAYMFGQRFLELSPEAQIIKFDEFTKATNANQLLKIQTLDAEEVELTVIEKEIEEEVTEISSLPSDVEIVIAEGEVGRELQLKVDFGDSKAGTFIAAEQQLVKNREIYKGTASKAEFTAQIQKNLEEFYAEIADSNRDFLTANSDLTIEELNSILRRRPEALAMLAKTKVSDANWAAGEIKDFTATITLQTENCPRNFKLPAAFMLQEQSFKYSNIARLMLDLCNSEAIIPLTCVNCALAPVDKVYKLSKDYVPNVVNTNLLGGGRLTPETVANLKQMFEDAAKAGAPMKVFSAYRSYQDQVGAFDYWYKRELGRGLPPAEARISANRYSAYPGHSEHQLGTTVDIGCDTCNAFDNSEGNLKAYAFIEANAHKYGFVVSYPKGTTQLTGYNYEPWHLRYVGRDIATELFNKGYLSQNGEHLAKLLVQKQQY